MSDSSIGIVMIMPKTGTSPKSPPAAKERDSDNATQTVSAVVRQEPPASPPPPGMGKLVDKRA